MMNRAFSLLEIKRADEDSRIITGIATTPEPDRMQDVVEPKGAQFKLPIPLLWQHDSKQPIGHVTQAKVTKAGIEISAKIAKGVSDEIDRAWSLIKAGLVSYLSIGFRSLEHSIIPDTGGMRFLRWEWLELSAVTIPANSDASITTIRAFDTARRAAHGRKPISLDITPAGASAPRQSAKSPEGDMQTRTIAEQISAFETQRVGKTARMDEIQQAAIAESRSKNEGERDEFDTLSRDIDQIDEELKDLRRMEAIKAAAAVPVRAVATPAEGAAQRGIPVHSSIVVRAPPKLEPGVEFARIVKVTALAMKNPRWRETEIAAAMYGSDSEVAAYFKAAVPGGTSLSPNWASNLISPEGAAAAAFLEYLRPATILGKFGQGGVPSLNEVPFRAPLVSETGAGAAWWVGEGAAKPVTQGAFARTNLPPTKLANICVLSMELVRDSSPKADVVIRNMLRAAIVQEQDYAFISPANSGTTNIKPASITNGADTVASSGDDTAAIILDIRSLFAKFTAANNPPSSGVWIMSSKSASALSMMQNALSQPSFPTVSMTGGSLSGMPIIVSDVIGRAGPNSQTAVPEIVVLVNARDIFMAQDDGIQIDQSDQVSLQMDDAPTMTSATPTGTSVVSMWQTNSIAIRAEHAIGWMKGRTSGVTYLTGVGWGGDVNT
jgi:HK97 family phage prohead protease